MYLVIINIDRNPSKPSEPHEVPLHFMGLLCSARERKKLQHL